MKLQLDMSHEAAALVRKMYENGELDDIVASMVRVDEPQDEAAASWLSTNEPTLSEKEQALARRNAAKDEEIATADAEARAYGDAMRRERAKRSALVEEASISEFASGTIHYGKLVHISGSRKLVTLLFKGETIEAHAIGDTKQRQIGDRVKVEMLKSSSDLSVVFGHLDIKILDD